MDDTLKGNSHKSKELENKHISKVISGPVKTKKKTAVHKFSEVFLAEDVAKVRRFIVNDVVIPTFKKAVVDIVTDGVNMLLYGESGRPGKRGGNSATRVSYSSIYERGSESRRDYNSVSPRTAYDYDDICLATRSEAEDVLASLDGAIEQYGSTSIADLYECVGITARYTDNRYGWTDLSNARPVHTRDGWMLKLPRVVDLKDVK